MAGRLWRVVWLRRISGVSDGETSFQDFQKGIFVLIPAFPQESSPRDGYFWTFNWNQTL